MSDSNNKKVKLVNVQTPHTVSSSIIIKETPWALALLPDGLVAVPTWDKVFYLLTVTDTLTVTSRIKTDVMYAGVAGHPDGTLIVSCRRDDNNGVARIDAVSRRGKVLRTVTDSKRLTQLDVPCYLCAYDKHVFVSDFASHAVIKVNVSNGQVEHFRKHPDIKYPRQVTVDASGNLFVASDAGQCVLVRSSGGEWRRLVEAPQDTDKEFDHPLGVCVTSSGRLYVAW
jgi:DNA-binding beta-propeller fold protein YncE